MKFILFAILTFISFVQMPMAAKLSLKEALEMGEKIDGIKAEEFEIEKAENQADLIDAKFNPKLDLVAGVGPINKAYGDAINSQNSEVTEIRNWRALYLVNVNGNYPLYAWGQKSDYKKAAALAKMIGREKVQIKKNEIRFQIKQAWYGHLLAANFLDFIKEGINDVETAKKKVRKNKNDLYRLQIFENILHAKKEEAQYKYDLSLEALKYLVGKRSGEQMNNLEEEWLEFDKRELNDESHYLKLLLESKPELKQLEKGAEAKDKLSKAIKKGNYPVLGIFMKYQYSHTEAREPQTSVYAYDPYNENSLVVGAGFKWNIDFGVTSNNSAKEKIESIQLAAKKDYAMRSFRLLVKKHWNEVRALENSLKSSKKALKFAKRFLNRTMIGGAMGLINAKEMVEAYQARILTFNEYFQKIHDYNLAWANLSLAVGKEVDPSLTGQE